MTKQSPAFSPLSAITLASALLLAGGAHAQSGDRPWYVGFYQDIGYQSNVLKSSGAEDNDITSTTALRGGLNLNFGRQRAFANAALTHTRYNDLKARNNNGYSLGAGLDWSTIERLSGNVLFSANRGQSDFNPGGIVPVTISNIERSEDLSAKVRLGVVTMLGFEATGGYRRVSFSAPEYASREYTQDRGSFGVTYRPSGILSLGTGISGDRTRYGAPAFGQPVADRSERRDLYLSATWVPTGASTFNGRVAASKIEYNRASAADFKGLTGYVNWAWKPTGLLSINTTLSRDSGQESGFLRSTPTLRFGALGFELVDTTASDFSQITNTLSVNAAYELTGKIMLDAGLAYARRNLVDGFTGAEGRDNTTTLSLGGKWAATRTVSAGCRASHRTRSARGAGSQDYKSDTFSCFGQVTLD